MRLRDIKYLFLSLAALTAACSDDDNNGTVDPTTEPPTESTDTLTLSAVRLQKLFIDADSAEAYRWIKNDSVISTEQRLIYIGAAEGTDTIVCAADYEQSSKTKPTVYIINVSAETETYSANVARAYEYRPAPGQFVNTLPAYEEGDTEESMAQKAGECLKNEELITLGAYGGYVTFGFDHTVYNRPGEKDFYIKGNAFYASGSTYTDAKAGSCEPGIVMVSLDKNGNGLPDDEWYELAGSEYHKETTTHDYQITYTRPAETDSNKAADVTWIDNLGQTGAVEKNSFHRQSYYPLWLADETMSFSGTLLPKNGVDTNGKGTYWVLYSFGWGYVDNHPNTDIELCSFDISWAVDSKGQSVSLPGADFIRVYNAENQMCGWLGETSTEVMGATDLSL